MYGTSTIRTIVNEFWNDFEKCDSASQDHLPPETEIDVQ